METVLPLTQKQLAGLDDEERELVELSQRYLGGIKPPSPVEPQIIMGYGPDSLGFYRWWHLFLKLLRRAEPSVVTQAIFAYNPFKTERHPWFDAIEKFKTEAPVDE